MDSRTVKKMDAGQLIQTMLSCAACREPREWAGAERSLRMLILETGRRMRKVFTEEEVKRIIQTY